MKSLLLAASLFVASFFGGLHAANPLPASPSAAAVTLAENQLPASPPRAVTLTALGTPPTQTDATITTGTVLRIPTQTGYVTQDELSALSNNLRSLINSIATSSTTAFTDPQIAAPLESESTGVDRSDGMPVCVSGDQLSAVLAAQGQQETLSPSPAAGLATTTPPTITIDGDNPAVIIVGDAYSDLGATITGPQTDLNLGINTFLNGALVSNIVIDTSHVATDTIDYVATDSAGLTATSTRIVVIDSTAATSTAQ